MDESHPVVFISYSHDDEPHRDRVYQLASALSGHGCEVTIDLTKETDEDWQSWMTRQVTTAQFVLCVISHAPPHRRWMFELVRSFTAEDWLNQANGITEEQRDTISKRYQRKWESTGGIEEALREVIAGT